MNSPDNSDGDHVYTLLSNSRRRYLLSSLQDQAVLSLEEVAAQLGALERDEPVSAVDDGTLERITISLVHNHLPRLEDHDILEYDTRSGDIVPADGFGALEPFIDQHTPSEGGTPAFHTV